MPSLILHCRARGKLFMEGHRGYPCVSSRWDNNDISNPYFEWMVIIRCKIKKASSSGIRGRVANVLYAFLHFHNRRNLIICRQWIIQDLGNGNVTLYNTAAINISPQGSSLILGNLFLPRMPPSRWCRPVVPRGEKEKAPGESKSWAKFPGRTPFPHAFMLIHSKHPFVSKIGSASGVEPIGQASRKEKLSLSLKDDTVCSSLLATGTLPTLMWAVPCPQVILKPWK